MKKKQFTFTLPIPEGIDVQKGVTNVRTTLGDILLKAGKAVKGEKEQPRKPSFAEKVRGFFDEIKN